MDQQVYVSWLYVHTKEALEIFAVNTTTLVVLIATSFGHWIRGKERTGHKIWATKNLTILIRFCFDSPSLCGLQAKVVCPRQWVLYSSSYCQAQEERIVCSSSYQEMAVLNWPKYVPGNEIIVHFDNKDVGDVDTIKGTNGWSTISYPCNERA